VDVAKREKMTRCLGEKGNKSDPSRKVSGVNTKRLGKERKAMEQNQQLTAGLGPRNFEGVRAER